MFISSYRTGIKPPPGVISMPPADGYADWQAQSEDRADGWAEELPSGGPVDGVGAFSTNFLLTENPISEGGKWVDGKTVGLDWNDIQSAANADGTGRGGFAGAPTAVDFDDSIAHLAATVDPNQFAQGICYLQSGYSPVGHEIELLLRFQITPHGARGYEVYWSLNQGIYIVRWNGPRGDFTYLNNSDSNVPATGRKLRAEMIGSTINVYLDDVLNVSATDGTWTDGHPGLGAGPYPTVSTLTSYGWSSWAGGAL